MISTLGISWLGLALLFSLIQAIAPFLGYAKNRPYALALVRPAAFGQFACVLVAYLLLTTAFITNDFSIAYVAHNSHPHLPFLYRLTALWGAHEGSILLWILLLNAWTLAYLLIAPRNRDMPLVLAILGIICTCFLGFLLFTSNPFLPAETIQSGFDLNPLLQDPGFVIHPPMLYTGYVGFSVAFAITLAALLRQQLTPAWASLTRQFATAAWCFLTFGIMLGSWWAYRVLGWGGFWFWDPVENASLLPWLSGAALIHTLILVQKRNMAQSFATLLAIITFGLSLLGTFLVRSGVLISAHTFASDPARGFYLLILLGLLITSAFLIYLIRMPRLSPIRLAFFSREMGLLINSTLLFVAMLTILLGTLYPLLLDAFHLGLISVGAPYFNTALLPILFILLFAMGFVSYRTLQQPIKFIFASLLSAIFLLWYFTGHLTPITLLSLSLGLWVLFSALHSLRFFPSMSIAHLGFGVLIIGILLSSLLNVEKEIRMKPGEMTSIGPYQFLFLDTQPVKGANYESIRADIEVLKNHRHITTLYPEKRLYTIREMVMTKVAIHPGIFRDLYIALGEPLDQSDWSMRIYYKPFIRWIWLGGFLMMLGGLMSFYFRKKVSDKHVSY